MNILVFPCGSEIGLEIYKSLEFSTHFAIIGANSIDDHGKFVYKSYIGGVPFVNTKEFIPSIRRIINDYNIDAIYPTMDTVIATLKANEGILGCRVISSCFETTEICLSKKKTYQKFQNIIKVPNLFATLEDIIDYPVFIKPDIGYGTRDTLKAENKQEADLHLKKFPGSIILEYLPGKEYTIDCFTDFTGKLLFCGPRERIRISNGISVNTRTMSFNPDFKQIAEKINQSILLNGSWFLQ